jgi:hypothetical protein
MDQAFCRRSPAHFQAMKMISGRFILKWSFLWSRLFLIQLQDARSARESGLLHLFVINLPTSICGCRALLASHPVTKPKPSWQRICAAFIQRRGLIVLLWCSINCGHTVRLCTPVKQWQTLKVHTFMLRAFIYPCITSHACQRLTYIIWFAWFLCFTKLLTYTCLP